MATLRHSIPQVYTQIPGHCLRKASELLSGQIYIAAFYKVHSFDGASTSFMGCALQMVLVVASLSVNSPSGDAYATFKVNDQGSHNSCAFFVCDIQGRRVHVICSISPQQKIQPSLALGSKSSPNATACGRIKI